MQNRFRLFKSQSFADTKVENAFDNLKSQWDDLTDDRSNYVKQKLQVSNLRYHVKIGEVSDNPSPEGSMETLMQFYKAPEVGPAKISQGNDLSSDEDVVQFQKWARFACNDKTEGRLHVDLQAFLVALSTYIVYIHSWYL